MKIQLNTDKNISGNQRLEDYLNPLITTELARFSEYITRVEVHLADENSDKKGVNDKKCTLEVRMENKQPFTVTSHSNTVEEAVNDALKKIKPALEKIKSQFKNH